MIKAVNTIGKTIKDLNASAAEVLNVTTTNVKILQEYSISLHDNFKTLADNVAEIASEVSKLDTEVDKVYNKIQINLMLFSKIHLLETHLRVIESVHHSCQKNQISKLSIPTKTLEEILLNQTQSLNGSEVKLLLPLTKIEMYYKMPLATCQLTSDTSLTITINLPLTSKSAPWHAFTLSPLRFLYKGLTCSLFTEKHVIASDGHSTRSLQFVPHSGTPLMYVLPRFLSPTDVNPCVTELFHSDNFDSIRKHCAFTCSNPEKVTVESLNSTSIGILNVNITVQIICNTRITHTLHPIQDGRYDVTLPCDCAAQELNGAVIISPSPWCQHSPTITVSKEWAGAQFTALEVVAAKAHALTLRQLQVTVPDLNLVTPSPLPSGNTWHDLPLVGSGKVETVLWSVFGLTGLISICIWLQAKFSLFTYIFKAISCLCHCCCARRNLADSQQVQARSPPVTHKSVTFERDSPEEIPLKVISATSRYRDLAGSAFSLTPREAQTFEA